MADTNLPPIQNKKTSEDDGPTDNKDWAPKNWTFFKKDLKKLAPQLKSKYLAYENPSKECAAAQANSKKRLVEKKKLELRYHQPATDEELSEKDKQAKLIGQLKAAEARNRIRIMRLRYQANRGQEINHLIACQPTARQAVRLQALLPSKPEDRSQGDRLDKLARTRVEALLEDGQGLLTLRT